MNVQLESHKLRTAPANPTLPRGNRLEALDILTGLVLGFPETMVASPLACLIAEGIRRGGIV
jgi:hypothetical protein